MQPNDCVSTYSCGHDNVLFTVLLTLFCPPGLSSLFIFDFLYLQLDIFSLILTVQYLTDRSFICTMYVFFFFFHPLGSALPLCSVRPVFCVVIFNTSHFNVLFNIWQGKTTEKVLPFRSQVIPTHLHFYSWLMASVPKKKKKRKNKL